MPSTYAVILAGGAGTRFWPASRSKRPKQLLPLSGKEALLRQTVERVLPLCGGANSTSAARRPAWDHVIIATGSHLSDATAAIVPEIQDANILREPVPRNTAPCIGWAAAYVARRDPDAVVMVLPSDHFIGDVERYRGVLRAVIASAAEGHITTIGIRPTQPETGYGYIEVAGSGATTSVVPLPVERFVEKPTKERAVEFLASGRYLWNAGMFFFRAKDMLDAIAAHLPDLARGLAEIEQAAKNGQEAEALARVFPTLPNVSIDNGVMERIAGLRVVPGEFQWNDIGSWQSAWELGEKVPGDNCAPEGAILIDAQGNHVVDLRTESASKRVIALVGVNDLVVVETDDALLVVPRSRAQDVKRIVDELKRLGKNDLI